MFLEIYSPLDVSMKYYGSGNRSLEIPFNFWFVFIANPLTGPAAIKTVIDQWMSAMPKDAVANWVVRSKLSLVVTCFNLV